MLFSHRFHNVIYVTDNMAAGFDFLASGICVVAQNPIGVFDIYAERIQLGLIYRSTSSEALLASAIQPVYMQPSDF